MHYTVEFAVVPLNLDHTRPLASHERDVQDRLHSILIVTLAIIYKNTSTIIAVLSRGTG